MNSENKFDVYKKLGEALVKIFAEDLQICLTLVI